MSGVADGTQSGIGATAAVARQAVNRADDAVHQATDAVAWAGNTASVTGAAFYGAGVNYLRAHPVFTFGVAMTTGFLLSRWLAAH